MKGSWVGMLVESVVWGREGKAYATGKCTGIPRLHQMDVLDIAAFTQELPAFSLLTTEVRRISQFHELLIFSAFVIIMGKPLGTTIRQYAVPWNLKG